ncbi:MAG: isoprenyl transferase [Desulfobacteraceae bacterium]|nr:isoprenyl transferase [Desulfobacteraceae bacterium]
MKSDLFTKFDIDSTKLPYHVAIIMDGNGRWAKKKLMNRVRGHEKGAETVRTAITTCRELGIKILTLYAFSTENWSRPQKEINALMKLLKKFIQSEKDELQNKNIKFNVIGQKERLPEDVQKELDLAIERTQDNNKMILNLALSYGAREEITQAVRKIAFKAQQGKLSPEEIDGETISKHLYTADMPDPDLLIRTSGEMRVSNFLLWQIAYSELFITKTLWPDFTRDEFINILRDYQERDRRFGKVLCS